MTPSILGNHKNFSQKKTIPPPFTVYWILTLGKAKNQKKISSQSLEKGVIDGQTDRDDVIGLCNIAGGAIKVIVISFLTEIQACDQHTPTLI